MVRLYVGSLSGSSLPIRLAAPAALLYDHVSVLDVLYLLSLSVHPLKVMIISVLMFVVVT